MAMGFFVPNVGKRRNARIFTPFFCLMEQIPQKGAIWEKPVASQESADLSLFSHLPSITPNRI